MFRAILRAGFVISALLGALVLTFALAGCSATREGAMPEHNTRGLSQREITLDDGRSVTCIVYGKVNGGGLSCDWEGAK